jgi:hypothetical protein
MEALLAVAATLVSGVLAADMARRWRNRPEPALLAWSGSLAAFAAASAAISWGAAAGWNDRSFRVYYLFGGLLPAALLGGGSLFRTRLPRALVAVATMLYVGLAIVVAVVMSIDPAVTGSVLPEPADHLDLLPARALALVGNVGGTLAAVIVAWAGIRLRPLGNMLIVVGVVAAASASAVASLALWGGVVFTIAAAAALYAGFVSPR